MMRPSPEVYLYLVLFVISESLLTEGVHYLRTANTPQRCHNNGKIVTSQVCPDPAVECCECVDERIGLGCLDKRCRNGVYNATTQQCLCWDLWTGSECLEVTECFNGGVVERGVCNCSTNWEGFFCQHPICQEGKLTGDKTRCHCNTGFYGQFCEIELICKNGTFSPVHNLCVCEKNFAQPTCEDCMEEYSLNRNKTPSYGSENNTQVTWTCEKGTYKEETILTTKAGLWIIFIVGFTLVLILLIVVGIWMAYKHWKRAKSMKVAPAPSAPYHDDVEKETQTANQPPPIVTRNETPRPTLETTEETKEKKPTNGMAVQSNGKHKKYRNGSAKSQTKTNRKVSFGRPESATTVHEEYEATPSPEVTH